MSAALAAGMLKLAVAAAGDLAFRYILRLARLYVALRSFACRITLAGLMQPRFLSFCLPDGLSGAKIWH